VGGGGGGGGGECVGELYIMANRKYLFYLRFQRRYRRE